MYMCVCVDKQFSNLKNKNKYNNIFLVFFFYTHATFRMPVCFNI